MWESLRYKGGIWKAGILLFFGFILIMDVEAQTVGDYRTAASGDWNAMGVWECYNGTTWTSATVLNEVAFSSGWTNVQVGGANGFVAGANSGLNGTGDAGLSIAGISQAWYYKAVTLIAGQTYFVNFDYIASTSTSNNKRIAIAIHSSVPTSAMFVDLGYTGATYFFNSLVASTSWVNRGAGQAGYLNDFTPATSGTYYLAVGVNQISTTTINLDNIVLRTIPNSSCKAITVRNGHNIEINNTITIDQTTIDAGGTLEFKAGTLTIAAGSGSDLLINGTFIRSANSFTINSSADIDIGPNGVYEHNVSGGSVPTITPWTTGSLLRIRQSVTGNLDQTFWNVTQVGANATSLSNDNVSKTMTVNNDFRLEGGTFYLKNAASGSEGGTHSLRVKGNFFHNGGNFGWNSDNNDNISVTNIFVEKDVNLSGTAAWTGFVNANNCNAGIFFDGNGIAQRFSTTLPHDVTGSVRNRFYYKTINGPIALHETYNGTVAQFTINGSCGASPPSGYERWPTSGTLLKTFTINNPAGVTLRGNRNINDTLYRTAGSLLAESGAVISYASGATLEYNGTTAITTESMEFPTAAGPTNLNINNAGSVALHASRSIGGKLIFSVDNGLLNTGACDALTSNVHLGINDNATIEGASNIRFVNGILRKTGNDPFTFPVGQKSGAVLKYAPVTITTPGNIADQFTACYLGNNPNASYPTLNRDLSFYNPSATPPVDYKVSTCEYWHVNRTAGTSNVSVTLSWAYGRSCSFNDASQLVVARWNGTQWTNQGSNGSNTTGPPITSGTVTSNGAVTAFSPFTLAHPTIRNVILNTAGLSLKGRRINGWDQLEWNLPPAHYASTISIEYSEDGSNFQGIQNMQPSGDDKTRGLMRYQRHLSFEKQQYYRLQIFTEEGNRFYSNTIHLCSRIADRVQVFPNPAFSQVTVSGGLLSVRKLTVINGIGQLIYTSLIRSGSLSHVITTDGWKPGVYYMQLYMEDGSREQVRFLRHK